MDWLAQNWIWIVVLIGAYLLFFRHRHHGFGSLGGHGGHAEHEDRPAPSKRAPIDPVSGRSLDAQHAITTYYQGRVYFFENEENRRRFEAAPDDFAKNTEGLDPAGRPHRGHRGHGC